MIVNNRLISVRCCSCEFVFMNPFLTDTRLLCNKLIAVQSTEIPSSFPQRCCTTKTNPIGRSFPCFTAELRCSRSAASLSHRPPLSLQQLLKMRDDLKQRELELEKSLEDKLQLKSQVQNLKEGLQKLQNSHAVQVSFTRTLLRDFGKQPCRGDSLCLRRLLGARKFICAALFVGEGRLPNLHFNNKEMRSSV